MFHTPLSSPHRICICMRAFSQAFFAELAGCGYGRLSIEAVARRAAVGKPAIYGRWRSKQDTAVALISEVALAHFDMPDTGSLRGDVIALLRAEHAVLRYPLAKAIIPRLAQRGQPQSRPGCGPSCKRCATRVGLERQPSSVARSSAAQSPAH
jgi:AcrR family transcriptional regulator